MWLFPIHPRCLTRKDLTSEQGSFGYKRSYYTHQGVDIYTHGSSIVRAVEPGTVVSVARFTVAEKEPHWLSTDAVMIEGPSGVICYGEINTHLVLGDQVAKGDAIACVVPVLIPSRLRSDIVGHSTHMLHFEWYTHGTTHPVEWRHGEVPFNILDPTGPLQEALDRIQEDY